MTIGRNLRLRKNIKTVLEELTGLTGKIFYRKAGASTEGPYIIYQFSPIKREENRVDYDLTIDIVDFGTDDTQCENLADQVELGLDYEYYYDGTDVYRVYAETRNEVEESDKTVIRRQLSFQLRMHD